jgi:lysophospholipase
VSWLRSAFKLMRKLANSRLPLRIRVPTLVLAAGLDPVCDTPATERFAARMKAGHAIVFPGARHEVLMERDAIRDLFWAAFDAFVPGGAEEGGPTPREFAGTDQTGPTPNRPGSQRHEAAVA